MDRPSRGALIRFGKATAATVVLGLCMVFLPLGLAIVMPFVTLPLVHVVMRDGMARGALLAALGGVLIWLVTGVAMGTLVFLLLVGVGMVLGEALRRRRTFGFTLGVTAGGALAALALWGVTLWQVFGLDVTTFRRSAFESIESAAALYGEMGVASQATELASSQLRALVEVLPYLAPGLLGMGMVLLAACTMGLAFVILPRLRDKAVVRLRLSSFRMPWAMAYVSIAGLAMLVLARGDGVWRTVLLYCGIDVLLIAQTLFFLQGLAVVQWFVQTRQVQAGGKSALYVVAVLGQVFLQLTGLLGLFDTWLDCRKRFAPKSPHADVPGEQR